jgi:tRNA threonylcarbamoyl adenosine modification protein YeaZ
MSTSHTAESRSTVRTIFAFDTATSVATCALVRDGEAVAEVRAEARSVLVAGDGILRSAGLKPRDLDAIVVGTGPGSFTGIRMGLATARGLALALGISVAGVSTLQAYSGGRPVIDARRGEVFTDGPSVGPPEGLDVAGSRLVGDGAIRYRDLFESNGAEVPPDDDPAHLPAAHLLVEHVQSFGPADLVLPLYLRAPDATPSR